jgi:valyl-tRNA synthetase
VHVLASDELDAGAVAARIDGRRAELEAEVKRAEGKLANDGFVAKAPPEVVESEREKLARYRSELDELAG